MAAVVTTLAIAAEFARKFNYINTFGGNPVSAAVGLAVLDVIEQENILQNVHDTGAYLKQGLENLAIYLTLSEMCAGKAFFMAWNWPAIKDQEDL